MADLQPLSLGTDTFERLRQKGSVYVDKTGLLGSFLTSDAPIFISRPRRFGKSLLCSTLRSFFTHGIEYFQGLDLEQWWQEQPESVRQELSGNAVLYLDFSFMKMRGVETFESAFKKAVAETIKAACPAFEVEDSWDAQDTLSAFLLSRDMASVVLLIDEYDAPVSHFLDKPHELWQIREILDDFYRMLKSLSNRLRFFFLTGVSRVTKIGVFSGFNNVWDLTLSGNYATLLGYTEEELHRYFDPHIQYAASILQQRPEEIYSGLKENYDGFRFTPESEVTLYTPWSVLKFLNEPGRGFINYWYESGALSTTLNAFFARSCELDLSHLDTKPVVRYSRLNSGVMLNIDDAQKTITPEYDPTLLLCQAGYYTIKNVELLPGRKIGDITLGLTNTEIIESLADTIRDNLQMALSTQDQEEVRFIKKYLLSGDLPKIAYILECFLNSWIYDDKTLSSENACRGLISTWLNALKLEVISEAHSAGGRCDLLLTIPEAKLRYAFEFKVQHQGENPDKRLEDALKQLVENDYGQVPPVSYELKKVGVVIGPDFRSIVKMSLVQD